MYFSTRRDISYRNLGPVFPYFPRGMSNCVVSQSYETESFLKMELPFSLLWSLAILLLKLTWKVGSITLKCPLKCHLIMVISLWYSNVAYNNKPISSPNGFSLPRVSLLHRHRIPDLLFRTACFLGAAVQLLSGLLLGLPNQG